MSNAKAKTIKLLLNEGTLKGVISMADSSWNSGKFYSAPRESIDDLLKLKSIDHYGVYLLLSDDRVYVGQASDLAKRVKQHIIGKTWWDRVVVFTTDNNSLDKADIDYLEASLIEKADKVGRLDSDNKNKGNKKKVNEFREVELEQYLDEALFLLELIGIDVFSSGKGRSKNKANVSINTQDDQITDSERERRTKKEAIEFLCDMGIKVGDTINYATRQPNKQEFWLNPRTDNLTKEWDLILNNQYTGKITVLHIPANTFQIKSVSSKGLYTRSDQPDKIDLNLSVDTFIDRRSKLNFGQYKVKEITY